ncbi:dTDP-4-dehydrorhamnose 3,5-epimerase [Lachnospiraceae bacterium MD308]|nr:dTDP-4-dehydrorhamnose 3,5-epimerase [Lachnospiraceae bacterium MD308]
MVFEEQSVKGCYLIKRNIPRDDRGYFSRLADVDEFRSNGLNSKFVQISVSRNYKKGTLRGLHMQIKPSAEEKLVCCVDGEIFDVCVDLRKDSDTYLKYCFAILSEENGEAFYIPKGCAHGFISLKDETRLIYLMTSAHDPEAERGYRWNDPAFSIKWPAVPEIISDKDNTWPLIGDEGSR